MGNGKRPWRFAFLVSNSSLLEMEGDGKGWQSSYKKVMKAEIQP